MRRRLARSTAALMLLLATAGVAVAVPPGMTIEFDGNGEGKVTFRGAQHTGAGMHCSDCHFELFDVSRSSQITRADHRRRQACFACHDGKTAFASRSNCERCHVEPGADTGPATETATGTSPAAATP
jgi:c(7)-type cytochrome triheme protein